jgi:hypothetical protein
MVIVWACVMDSVYIGRNRSIKADVSLYTGGRTAEGKVLLDSGTTENLIHPRMVKRYQLPTKQLKNA